MLWIVPPPSHSSWYSRLDWYLNWQMSKGQSHQNAPPHAEIYRLAEEHGLKVELHEVSEKAPLMISGAGLIPAEACIVVAYGGELKEWLSEAKTLASHLNSTQAQVYLPAGVVKDQAQKIWEKLSGHCSAQFLEDHA